jgi:hypothetical protein
MTIPEKRWPARRELKLQNEYRAYYMENAEAQADEPVRHIYLIVSRGERFLLARSGPEAAGILVEPVKEGEAPADVARRIAKERVGATIGEPVVSGHLRCLATKFAKDAPPGAIHLRQVMVAAASEVEDLPEDSPWERRTVNQRDLILTIGKRHIEIADALRPAVSEWVKLRAQGKI